MIQRVLISVHGLTERSHHLVLMLFWERASLPLCQRAFSEMCFINSPFQCESVKQFVFALLGIINHQHISPLINLN